jgi:hypothetical protein
MYKFGVFSYAMLVTGCMTHEPELRRRLNESKQHELMLEQQLELANSMLSELIAEMTRDCDKDEKPNEHK